MSAEHLSNEAPAAINCWINNLRSTQALGHVLHHWRILETHISWVILTGDFAYKIKKPVALGFLDFSTLAKRHFFCLEELRLNRRFAPEIYLGLVEIRGSLAHPKLQGDGDLIEYAIKMRQFSQQDLLSAHADAGTLDASLIDAVALRVSAVHADCETATSDRNYGSVAVTRHWVMENFTHLAATVPAELLPPAYHRLRIWYRRNSACEKIIAERKTQGYVRECHGDLHLGNLALIEQRVTLFDCLEFNPELRWIDTISEVAFVVMDLQARGYAEYSWRFINRYLQDCGDYAGTALLRYYFVHRALVRAKVEALRAAQKHQGLFLHADALRPALAYLELADRWAQEQSAAIILMHGLSASGKSTVAAKLAEDLGAIHIRSDIERKRLFGLSADADSGSAVNGGIYTADADESTYARLQHLARLVVDADLCAIIDATCLHKSQRDAFLSLTHTHCHRVIVACDAPPAELERRLLARGRDVSEANLEVLRRQFDIVEPIADEELQRTTLIRIDACGLSDAQIDQIRLALAN